MATYFEHTKINLGEAVYAGVFAGIFAGVAMSMVAMTFAMMVGQGIWEVPKMIAVTILDRAWLDRSGFQVTPLLVGMMIHFSTAIAFGIIFAILGGRLSEGRAVCLGTVYGLGIWLLMQFILLPIVNPMMAGRPYLLSGIEHAVFGVVLGSYPASLPAVAESQP
ncbi:MAG: DUF1440 domain-containing protein [Candidatus Manganitrophus sp. SA1]|nr:DUF1440 domain-containing protein [Candidatus Manganitrophus morganii]